MSSTNIRLERAGGEARELVQAIVDRAPRFHWNVDGVSRSPDFARKELEALPPGRRPEHKFFWVAYLQETPFAVVDLIQDYPGAGTAFLGLLLVDEGFQSRGLGRRLYEEVERRAREQLAAVTIRLAVNDSNPVRGFWEKMGFRPTGESKAHQGIQRASILHLMEKRIA